MNEDQYLDSFAEEPVGEYPGEESPEDCSSEFHLPQKDLFDKPGLYQHKCFDCGHISYFTIPKTTKQDN